MYTILNFLNQKSIIIASTIQWLSDFISNLKWNPEIIVELILHSINCKYNKKHYFAIIRILYILTRKKCQTLGVAGMSPSEQKSEALVADAHESASVPVRRILTIDGGGIRGIIPGQILTHIENLLKYKIFDNLL